MLIQSLTSHLAIKEESLVRKTQSETFPTNLLNDDDLWFVNEDIVELELENEHIEGLWEVISSERKWSVQIVKQWKQYSYWCHWGVKQGVWLPSYRYEGFGFGGPRCLFNDLITLWDVNNVTNNNSWNVLRLVNITSYWFKTSRDMNDEYMYRYLLIGIHNKIIKVFNVWKPISQEEFAGKVWRVG